MQTSALRLIDQVSAFPFARDIPDKAMAPGACGENGGAVGWGDEEGGASWNTIFDAVGSVSRRRPVVRAEKCLYYLPNK